MSARLTAAELAAINRRFQQMGGAPASKTLSQAELAAMERKYREMERNAALRTFRATNGKRATA